MLLALASCFFTPERPSGQIDPHDDAGFDGVLADAVSIDAATHCPSDDMSAMADVCGTWGVPDLSSGGSVGRGSGVLNATVSAAGARAGCRTTSPVDFSHGVSIALKQPLQGGSGDTTSFAVALDANGTMIIEVVDKGLGGLQIVATCSGPGGFTGAATFDSSYAYLKIAPQTPGSTTVFAYHAGSGSAWTTFGSCSVTGNTTATALVSFSGTAGSASGSRMAKFDDFKTCTTP